MVCIGIQDILIFYSIACSMKLPVIMLLLGLFCLSVVNGKPRRQWVHKHMFTVQILKSYHVLFVTCIIFVYVLVYYNCFAKSVRLIVQTIACKQFWQSKYNTQERTIANYITFFYMPMYNIIVIIIINMNNGKCRLHWLFLYTKLLLNIRDHILHMDFKLN